MLRKVATVVLMILMLATLGFAGGGTIKGTVVASDTGEPLVGANVTISGTFLGGATDEDGYFLISNIPFGTVTIEIDYLGFTSFSKSLELTQNNAEIDMEIKMEPTMYKTQTVIVEASRAKERETPVAFTNITKEQIENNFTVQDVPHLFKNTVGVYVTSDGGSGMGDSKTYIRGFDEQRISVMINGIEVNDPESKKVYWSNWGSLPGGSQAIQVQRGAGSTLYGAGAFGGSINVVTQDAIGNRRYSFTSTIGRYGTYKLGGEFNSGLMGEKWSFTGKTIYLTGNGWRKNTFYRGLQYYFTLNYFMNKNHTFRIILHGAPQYHAYSYYSNSARDLARFGRDLNSNPWVRNSDSGLTDRETDGTSLMDLLFLQHVDKDKGGEVIGNGVTSFDNNVYHKPQLEIHHTWDINATTYLQTTLFLTTGVGYGENVNNAWMLSAFGYRDDNGEITMQDLVDLGTYQYRAHSIHQQAGLVSTYNTKWNEHQLSAGVEAKFWKARHYGLIANTFGQDYISYYVGGERVNFREGDVYYDYTTVKPNYSAFGHGLWKFGNFSIMTDLQYSLRLYHLTEDLPGSNNRPDPNGDFIITQNLEGGNDDGYVNYSDTTYTLVDLEESFSFLSPKFGINYNVNKNLSVFGNVSRVFNEPRVKYFYNYGQPIDNLDTEISTDYEMGFSYADQAVSAKVNLYRIDFENKAYLLQDYTMANQPGYDYKGRRYVQVGTATYKGIEIQANAQLTPTFQMGAAITLAENAWTDDISELAQEDLGINEGDIEPEYPQKIFAMTAQYSKKKWFVSGAVRHYEDYYILPSNDYVDIEYNLALGQATERSATLPAWTVADMIIGYRDKFQGATVSFSLHINNLFDTEYLQSGNKYGFIPGAERNFMFNMAVTL